MPALVGYKLAKGSDGVLKESFLGVAILVDSCGSCIELNQYLT